MRCDEAHVLLSARLDGELTAQEERELNTHLAGCPACRVLAEELSALHLSLETLEDESAPEGFSVRVMEAVRASERESKVVPLFRRPWFRAAAGLAACAVLCVGLYAASQARKSAALDTSFQVTARAFVEDAVTGDAAADEFLADEAESALIAPQSAEYGAVTEYRNAGDNASNAASGASPYICTTAQSETDECKQVEAAKQEEAGAVLTLSAWPEGGDGVLHQETPVSFSPEEGVTRYSVTQEQFEALAELAQVQGLLLERTAGDGSSWTVKISQP